METAQQNASDNAINFSVYTPRTVTRAGVGGISTDAGLKDNTTDFGKAGFGIIAYYTDDEKYDGETSTPNFMYNTQVKYNASSTSTATKWEYNPVMYWPNEFGTSANSENIDYVSFFAYAPYIDVTNETGIPELKDITTFEYGTKTGYDAFAASLGIKYAETEEKTVTTRALYAEYKGVATLTTDDDEFITAYNAEFGTTYNSTIPADVTAAETALGTCGITYYNATLQEVTDLATFKKYLGATTTDAEAQAALDELWKEQIQGKNITEISKNTTTGDPIVKYVVDANPTTSVDLLWGVAAKTAATDYKPIVDGRATVEEAKPFVDLIKPKDPAASKLNWNLLHALAKLNVNIKYTADQPTTGATSETINNKETRIYVRWIKIGGFVMKGALNLNSKDIETRGTVKYGVPNWKGYDGKTALNYETITFNDGRKDGKEGTYNGQDKNEANVCLNPDIVENYSQALWPNGKTSGVTDQYVNLFGGPANAPIFVIPTGEDIDIEICYDVETKDAALAGLLSDGVTAGSVVPNTIRKSSKDIFGGTAATQMKPGMGYNVNIILGMTSVKFEASVSDWNTTTAPADVDLPDNQ